MISSKPVLLYDIDGTLLNVKRKFLFGLIEERINVLNISKAEARLKSFAGRTDRGIFMELIGSRPDADELFHQLKVQYTRAMLEELKANHIRSFSDAVESVREAAGMGLAVGLCTGNFRPVAMKKVETAGLTEVFRFGGFGGEHEDRNHLPAEAERDYRSVYGDKAEPERFVVIGDTPGDILCAKFFGALSVAVTTGGFSKSELSRYKPNLIVESLKNPGRWLSQLGFRNL